MNEDVIYEILSVVEEIPPGRVATYGQVARLIGREKNSVWWGRSCVCLSFMGATPATAWSTMQDAWLPVGRSRPLCWPRRALRSRITAMLT